jgi:hypothetical protein
MFQDTELCPGNGHKSIEMTLWVIRQRGLSFPPSIRNEDDVVRRPDPWRQDLAAKYLVTAHRCHETLLEPLISQATYHYMNNPVGFPGK